MSSLVDPRFSVVIPTLQRSPHLFALIAQCAAHPLVSEVLVINNAPEPIADSDPKVRVLDQGENIFVNPAWNLGAREADADLLAIINDDLHFPDDALDHAAEILRTGRFAMVGPDNSCFIPQGNDRRISHRFASGLRFRYGTFMCLRRADYVPIPDDLLIWGGDDWLFWSQRRPNAVLVHAAFATEMGTTSGSSEFQAMRQREHEVSARLFASVYGTRWWHRPAAIIERLRLSRARMRSQLTGSR